MGSIVDWRHTRLQTAHNPNEWRNTLRSAHHSPSHAKNRACGSRALARMVAACRLSSAPHLERTPRRWAAVIRRIGALPRWLEERPDA